MAYASRSGRARTSSRSPRAFAVCDRCGIWENHQNLRFQYDWRGAQLANLRFLVCRHCYDKPQQNGQRTIRLPADPVSIANSRPEQFQAYEEPYYGTEGPYGAPNGLDPNAVMPFQWNGGVVAYGVALSVLSMVASGTTVTVTCSAAHGLETNAQIAVSGTSVPAASGFYSVTVLTAMALTYTIASSLAGSVLTGSTRVITCNVGLPYGVTTIPSI